jgi:hypothetical protein
MFSGWFSSRHLYLSRQWQTRRLKDWACFELRVKLNSIARTTPWFGSISKSGPITFKGNVCTDRVEQPCLPVEMKHVEMGIAARYWAGGRFGSAGPPVRRGMAVG